MPESSDSKITGTTGKLFVGALVAAALIGGLIAFLRVFEPERDHAAVRATEDDLIAPAPLDARKMAELVPPPRVEAQSEEWNEPTSVLWPCRVELDLAQADYLPTAPDVPPIGTGRGARVSGRISGAGDHGVRASITFVAGPNEGRVLLCDGTGKFGATDLYPGLAIVQIRGDGLIGAKREVRLRSGSEAQLNLGFGLLASVRGRIVDSRGEPIRGAKVEVDGHEAISGEEGRFGIQQVAGGNAVVLVEHPDFASLMAIHPVAAGREQQGHDLDLTLDDPMTISISTPQPVGGPGPTQVYLLPTGGQRPSRGVYTPVLPTRYPWFTISPIEVPPGAPVVVRNLPREVFKAVAFRQGAVAREELVNPRADRINPVQIHLQPAPMVTGIVTFRGKPMPGAEVTLEAPDQVRANLGYLRQPSFYLESEVVPYFPPARQSVFTDGEGRYRLTAWADVANVRYLEARGPDGSWAGRLVTKGDERVDLELKSVELGDSSLVLEFPGRTQGLPLEIVINGAPQDPYVLSPYRELVIESLLAGRWDLNVTWNDQPVFVERGFLLSGDRTFTAALPLGAVEGQDQEAWRRAGRTWPFGLSVLPGAR